MKLKIARYLLTAAGVIGIAGTPALFADDLHRDYRNLDRQNEDIRRDQRRLRDDREDGRYWKAERDREDLNRDYYRRERQVRDVRRDQYYRNNWR